MHSHGNIRYKKGSNMLNITKRLLELSEVTKSLLEESQRKLDDMAQEVRKQIENDKRIASIYNSGKDDNG